MIGDPIDTSAVSREHRCATCSTFYNSGYGEKWKELRKDGETDRRTFGDRAKTFKSIDDSLALCLAQKEKKKGKPGGKRGDTRKRSYRVRSCLGIVVRVNKNGRSDKPRRRKL